MTLPLVRIDPTASAPPQQQTVEQSVLPTPQHDTLARDVAIITGCFGLAAALIGAWVALRNKK